MLRCLQTIAWWYGSIVNILPRNFDIHNRTTRKGHINLYCPRFKFESDGDKSVSVSITRLWNSVPSTILSLPTLNSFNKSYRKLLSDSYDIVLLISPYFNFLS